MNPTYIEHFLSVLLEEYEDIGYMLDSIEPTLTPQQNRQIRQLLQRLEQENHKLLTSLPKRTPARMGRPMRPAQPVRQTLLHP